MKLSSLTPSALLVVCLTAASSIPTIALAEGPNHASAAQPAAPADQAAWLAKAKADYPLDSCVVSGDKLGEMGSPVDFVYQEAGKPDRLIRFCCKDCVKDFKKDPAAYLKKLDAAAAAKSVPAGAAH